MVQSGTKGDASMSLSLHPVSCRAVSGPLQCDHALAPQAGKLSRRLEPPFTGLRVPNRRRLLPLVSRAITPRHLSWPICRIGLGTILQLTRNVR
jgi:hypothetical protein